jgi:hypothetical protein
VLYKKLAFQYVRLSEVISEHRTSGLLSKWCWCRLNLTSWPPFQFLLTGNEIKISVIRVESYYWQTHVYTRAWEYGEAVLGKRRRFVGVRRLYRFSVGSFICNYYHPRRTVLIRVWWIHVSRGKVPYACTKHSLRSYLCCRRLTFIRFTLLLSSFACRRMSECNSQYVPNSYSHFETYIPVWVSSSL